MLSPPPPPRPPPRPCPPPPPRPPRPPCPPPRPPPDMRSTNVEEESLFMSHIIQCKHGEVGPHTWNLNVKQHIL